MENTIDFYFNPLFTEGAEFVLQNVRNIYPPSDSKIFVWIDDDYPIKNKIIDITNKYNSTSMISTNKFTWCSRNNPEESKKRLLEFCRRFQKTAETSTAKWIMYLEDDVLIRDNVINFPETNAGINPGHVASGGSIHLTETIRNIFKKYSDDELLKIMNPNPLYWAADRLLLVLYSNNGYNYSIFSDLADGKSVDETDKPILHNIKTHYPPYWKEYRKYLDGELDNNPINIINNMKYTIVGCITKYGVEQIRPFVESIERIEFGGDKLMLVYEITQDTIDYLNDKGWTLIQSEPHQHIILQRFRDMYQVLHQYETDIIIWVDVKDIIFQKDPTDWLNANMNNDILAFSESLKFGDEAWARLNAGTSFPMEWEWLQNEEICCAGTIVGKRNAIRDLFIDIYRWSLTTSNPEQLADQAAYNILIRLHQFKDIVQFVKQQEGFAAQLHLKLKKGSNLPYTEELVTIDGDEVKNSKGELFTLVHQYDRNEELKKLIENKYK